MLELIVEWLIWLTTSVPVSLAAANVTDVWDCSGDVGNVPFAGTNVPIERGAPATSV